MVRAFLCLLMIGIQSVTFAQDEFPDYRSKKDNFNKVREKDIRGDLAAFAMAGIDESTGKLPLNSIPIKDYGRNYMTFEGNDIRVTVRSAPFDQAKHKLTYYDTKYLTKIDTKPFYGNYGKLPKTVIESVTVTIGKDTVAIPPAAYADLYNPTFNYTDASGNLRSLNAVYLSPDKHHIYIYMLNKETVGSYEVTWVIMDKTFQRRVLDFGLLK